MLFQDCPHCGAKPYYSCVDYAGKIPAVLTSCKNCDRQAAILRLDSFLRVAVKGKAYPHPASPDWNGCMVVLPISAWTKIRDSYLKRLSYSRRHYKANRSEILTKRKAKKK